jgi:hypothetical protein
MNADFEKQLQRQPLRKPPRDWRAEILVAAADSRPSAFKSRGEGISIWPSLRGWAALGAVWVVIFLLHLSAPDEPRLAGNSPVMTMRSFALLHEQTLMMAQLLGQTDQTDAVEPSTALPAAPKPRSEIARKQFIG